MPPSRPSKDRNSKEARVLANRYEVLKKLGSGNFGVAFLCNDIKNENEQKVLKEISVGDLQPDETVDAMHEARLLSRLDHPSIVKFHDSFIDGEFFCIITEYCDGGDLDDKITEYKKKGMKFEEKTVLDWIVQLTMALQYMHSRRVLHRDLKTRNIFLRQNMVKIGDFGISRILMGTTDMASTFTGTPYYMSPEVLKHEGYNSKSDVWSVGCILYELCALDHAFNGQGLMGVMYKIVEGEAPDIPKKYSRDLNDVMKKMLTKEPDLRPGAQEVLKLPYVLQHINKMKDTLTDEYRSRHHGNLNEEKAEKEAQEIAYLLREKSHLEDLRKTEVKEELKMKDTKYMSPRERMRLRKMQEADKRGTELQKHAKVKLKENADRSKALKDTMSKTTVPAWKGGSGEGGTLTSALYVPDPRLTGSVSEEYATFGPHYRALSASHHGFYDDDDDNDVVTGKVLARTAGGRLGSLSAPKDRPITPMRNTMVYNREHSTLDFKDGIPDSPELAETYYSQFEGEFEDSSPEKEKADEIGEGEEKEEEDEEGEGTIVAGGDDEMADYISRLEGALHTASSNEDTVISDDTISGAFGPGARDIKIKNLKKQCIASLGEEAFKKAYDYLRKARSDDKKSESDIMIGLRVYVKNPSDCFIVDQLLFLEDVAKDS
ncbi:serine/threonine-protein kinase Nek11-like [Littorina saxatilis]|uniref:non-specific serine/threonine protein kinase n=1 Tax=Littorina saxatilis TaxID=31220 RepID=A0AAN9BWM0_9CAEN